MTGLQATAAFFMHLAAKTNTMKKMYVCLIGFACAAGAHAQTAPVWGIKGGLNFATWNHSDANTKKLLDPRLGYHFGIISHNHLSHKSAQ